MLYIFTIIKKNKTYNITGTNMKRTHMESSRHKEPTHKQNLQTKHWLHYNVNNNNWHSETTYRIQKTSAATYLPVSRQETILNF